MADTVNLELLKRLCATPGIAGREDRVRSVVAEEVRPLVDELRVDALGSVVGTKHGDGPRVMLAAHMDEIRFFVSHIDDNGFLRLQPVGGFNARSLVAQRVLVHGFDGAVLRGALQRSRCRSRRAMSTPPTRWPTAKTSLGQSACWHAFSKTRDRDPMGTSRSLASREMVTDPQGQQWPESSSADRPRQVVIVNLHWLRRNEIQAVRAPV